MKLFEERDDKTMILFETGMNHFQFYEQSALPEIEEQKQDFNRWFEHYPDEDKAKLKKDFQTENKFNDAWFELFVHELFYQQGFSLEVHPTLKDSAETPDFFATKKRYPIYIEAKRITGLTTEEGKRTKIRDSIIDKLQKVDLPDHMLMLQDLSFGHGASPSLKKVAHWLKGVVGKIETAEIKTSEDLDSREVLTFTCDELTIQVKVLSSSYQKIFKGDDNASPHRPFGVIWEGFTMTEADHGAKIIRKAIDLKARKYGKLDKAFLLCLNLANWNLDIRRDVDWALFSDVPDSKGYFNSYPPKHPKVSAILFTKSSPNNYKHCDHRLILNPHAHHIYHFEYSELSFEMIKTKTDFRRRKDISDLIK